VSKILIFLDFEAILFSENLS